MKWGYKPVFTRTKTVTNINIVAVIFLIFTLNPFDRFLALLSYTSLLGFFRAIYTPFNAALLGRQSGPSQLSTRVSASGCHHSGFGDDVGLAIWLFSVRRLTSPGKVSGVGGGVSRFSAERGVGRSDDQVLLDWTNSRRVPCAICFGRLRVSSGLCSHCPGRQDGVHFNKLLTLRVRAATRTRRVS